MAGETHSAPLLEAYREFDLDRRILYSKVGCVLSLVLVPGGSLLEYFTYPELLWDIFKARTTCSVLTLAIFALHFTASGRRHAKALGLAWTILPQVIISYMIYLSEGAASPYYAGLNLVILAASVLLPWTLVETLFMCVATMVLYLAACYLHRGTPVNWSALSTNVLFMLMTDAICVTASRFTSRSRFEDFRLRHELNVRNKEIAESYERLAEMDKLKSEFFANVSHEFRTPLTLIVSPIEDLLRQGDRLPEPVRESLKIARQNSLRLLKLINDLLEIVRLEEGGGEIRREPVDLAIFVPGLVDSTRGLAKAKGLSLKLQGEDGPLVVQGDPERLEKVFLNILTNAVKFTPSGGAITTRWRRESSTAVVEVEDTGIGIAAKDLPFIFDRFRQADGSSTRKYQGVGIGLSLARELVEKHGGRLTARSELGRGTTLRVELPVAGDSVVAPAPRPRDAAPEDALAGIYRAAELAVTVEREGGPSAPEACGQGEFTVLVVEDVLDMRRFLVSVLSGEYRVLQASDGEAGLATAREHAPDLVVLDLMLPGMDGLAVCKALKGDAATSAIRIVLLTARADDASKITALEYGADDFLTKPFSTLELRTRLANLLRTARLERDVRERNTQLENTLARLRETEMQLIQSEKMSALGSLAAGLLHEINNPLNFTMTALQVARESVPESDEDLKEAMEDMGEGMGRIRDIVADLRTFAHPSSREGMKDRFELGESLDAALRLVAHEVKDIAVERDLQPGCWVVGARNQMTHVLMNLLVNSAKALQGAPAGRKPLIRISSRSKEGRLHVRVFDNGSGIKLEVLPRVFDPFFTTRDVGEGMGLGLSICHTIVRNHGGNIVAGSREGEWTEVTFDLPLESEGI